MNVRKTLNWDKLAIVLSVAVITLALMAQTMYANGAARVNGAAASGSLSYQTDATDTGDGGGGISDATDTGDGGGGIGDGTDTDDADLEIGDATDTDDGPRGDNPLPPAPATPPATPATNAALAGASVATQPPVGNVTRPRRAANSRERGIWSAGGVSGRVMTMRRLSGPAYVKRVVREARANSVPSAATARTVKLASKSPVKRLETS